jgi:DNA-binding transcriptional MerR regulator
VASESLKLREVSADPTDDQMGIGDACRETGLSQRTVRYYEELGLLPGVRRRAAGRRIYGQDELERLRFIQRLKTLGLSLAEIKKLNAVYGIGGSTVDMLRHLDGQLGKQLHGLDARIEQLGALRDEMSRYRDHIDARIGVSSAKAAEMKASEKETSKK